jgi:hypothetical protein
VKPVIAVAARGAGLAQSNRTSGSMRILEASVDTDVTIQVAGNVRDI